MPESTPNLVEDNATQGAPAEKLVEMSQEKFDSVMAARLERQKTQLEKKFAEEHAHYDEWKEKAAKFDELEEASKSELQRAVERADKLQAQLDALEAEKARADAVAEAASHHGVDAALLARMSGDVEENAQILKQYMDAQPKYAPVPDHGEANPPAAAKKEIPTVF